MRIRSSNRTADVDLSAVPRQPKVTVKVVIDDFREQLPSNFSELFEAFVLLLPHKVRVTCRSPGSSSCPVGLLSIRFVYQQLSRLDHREHRCVTLYRGWGLPVDWTTVWLNLRLWRLTRPVRDTNWLVAHGVLPTVDRLTRFGMRIDPSCHCGQAESLVHLFVDCPVAKRLFVWYQMLVCRAAPSLARPSPSQLLLGYNRSVHIPPMFPCLFGIIRHCLRIARNAFHFEQTPVVFSSILSSVKSSLRFGDAAAPLPARSLCGVVVGGWRLGFCVGGGHHRLLRRVKLAYLVLLGKPRASEMRGSPSVVVLPFSRR